MESQLNKQVPPTGSTFSEVMVVGLAPGEAECQHGQPFMGEAGQLVRLITTSLLKRVYLTNVIKSYVSNATKTDLIKMGGLTMEVTRVQPRVVVSLGERVTSYILGQQCSIKTMHGLRIPVNRFGEEFILLPTFDPGYVIRQGGLMSEAGDDWILDWHQLKEIDDLGDLQEFSPESQD